MIDPRRSVPILATVVLVLAACGGGGAGAPAASTAASEPAASAVIPDASTGSVVGAPTTETSAAPSVAAPAPGGGSTADVCALVTGDELAAILGTAVTTQVFAGPPDTCDIQSTDGAPLAAFVLTNMGGVSAAFVYDAFAGSPTAEAISGIGEKAAHDPGQGALVVLKNGAVLSIAVFDDGSGSTDSATRLDQMKQIGTIAASRM